MRSDEGSDEGNARKPGRHLFWDLRAGSAVDDVGVEHLEVHPAERLLVRGHLRGRAKNGGRTRRLQISRGDRAGMPFAQGVGLEMKGGPIGRWKGLAGAPGTGSSQNCARRPSRCTDVRGQPPVPCSAHCLSYPSFRRARRRGQPRGGSAWQAQNRRAAHGRRRRSWAWGQGLRRRAPVAGCATPWPEDGWQHALIEMRRAPRNEGGVEVAYVEVATRWRRGGAAPEGRQGERQSRRRGLTQCYPA